MSHLADEDVEDLFRSINGVEEEEEEEEEKEEEEEGICKH